MAGHIGEPSGAMGRRQRLDTLLAVAISVAFYSLGVLVKVKPTTYVQETEQRPDNIVVSLMPPTSDQGGVERMLYDWTLIEDPAFFYRTNDTLGYGKMRPHGSRDGHSPMETPVWQPTPVLFGEQSPLTLGSTMPPIAQVLMEEWPTDTVVEAPSETPLPRRRGVFWFNSRGERLLEPPDVSLSALQEAYDRQRPKRLSVFEVSYLPGLALPRILVRESCGNRDIDEILMTALRACLLKKDAPSGGLSWAGRRPWADMTLQVSCQLAKETAASGATPTK